MWTPVPIRRRQSFDINRVIEIARIIGVDRDDELVAQIFAFRKTTRIDGVGNVVGFLQHFRRKLERKVIFPNDREHVDSRIRSSTEELDDLALGIDVARFPGFQPNDNFVLRLRRARCARERARLHINVVHKSRIIGHDVKEISRSAAMCRRLSRGRVPGYG